MGLENKELPTFLNTQIYFSDSKLGSLSSIFGALEHFKRILNVENQAKKSSHSVALECVGVDLEFRLKICQRALFDLLYNPREIYLGVKK